MPNRNIKQIAELDINGYDDRRAIVGILADNGYIVEVQEVKEKTPVLCLTSPSSYKVVVSKQEKLHAPPPLK